MKKINKYLFLSALLCAHTTHPLQSSLNFFKDKSRAASRIINKSISPVTFTEIKYALFASVFEGSMWHVALNDPTPFSLFLASISFLSIHQVIHYLVNKEAQVLIANNDIETLECLLQRNVLDITPEITDLAPVKIYEKSLLHEASRHQRVEIVKMLLQAGVDISAKDHDGQLASDYAKIQPDDLIRPFDSEAIIKRKSEKRTNKMSIQKLLNFYNATKKLPSYLNAMQQKQEATDLVEIVIENTTSMSEYCPKEDIANIIMSYLSIEDEIKEAEEKKD